MWGKTKCCRNAVSHTYVINTLVISPFTFVLYFGSSEDRRQYAQIFTSFLSIERRGFRNDCVHHPLKEAGLTGSQRRLDFPC